MQFAVIAFFLFPIFYTAFAASTPVCTNGFTLINSKCLKLYTTPSSYSAAEESCRSVGATLVTVKNANDNQAITTIVGSTVSLVWMGLYCLDSDPSKCLWDDSTGSAGIYSNFASGFPLVDIGKCVYYSVQGALAGKWVSGDCDNDPRAYVCELPYTVADNCTYNYNGFCYSLHSSAAFVQAQETCEQECGNLVSITSEMENRYIATIENPWTNSDWVYIGAMFPRSNAFAWIDGSVWSYNNIDPSISPNSGNCAAIGNSKASSYGFWVDTFCSDAWPFICKRPAGAQCPPNQPTVTVTPVPNQPSYCNSTLLLAPGVITSPNYPQNYDNNLFCSYQLATLGSYKILLQFSGFITESSDDIVKVYDGDSSYKPLLGSYSGNLGSFNVVSTGNTVYVTFKTDGSNVFQGFSARFLVYSGS
ncbi:hypothetical protein GCK72_007171 [Caenorhabditis remanei]|uniref:Uncharacterized protein n=1 Tax=Caenorhabditis remanei TaxID=31234 RepID=A0A6A5HN58_CAERE|nr:hypothetical protein GCK72_007171 [Caenorhabditis remanei]KAF1767212.1 hypothetical protein GCK72_007171 [Caenorhabditis remanei]